jgi:uncharacterized protein (TIGR02145 family)
MKTILCLIICSGFLSCNIDWEGYIKTNNNDPDTLNILEGTMVDTRDNEVYKTIKIGDHWWMAENLKYNVEEGSRSWCYNNDPLNCNQYGRLYQWELAMTVCPTGWHLSSDEEWKLLEQYLGMSESDLNSINFRNSGSVGKKLKSTSGWDRDGNGTNASKFNAYPAGIYKEDQTFVGLTFYTEFWTSTDYFEYPEPDNIWYRGLNYGYDGVNRAWYRKQNAFSVRCVQDY